MIGQLLFATVPVGTILLCSEYLWRRKVLKGERARKFIHILAGVWMAFWPFYIPFDGVFLLGCAAFTILVYSRLTRLFHAIYAVRRRTYGELFYALGLVACSYVAQEPWIFTTSILFLALADGGAAVVGRFWGLGNQYRVFGMSNLRKSVAGTAAFVVLAYISIGVGLAVGGYELVGREYTVLLGLPLGLALVENISPYGLDNLVTPILSTAIFNSLI